MTTRERTILLVDDDESLRRILARHLRSRQITVTEADSAEAAAELLRDGLRPGLLILDVNLPGDTGWDLLRGHDWRAAGSPPVVVSSATSVSPKLFAEFRCAGWLPKPFPLETLDDTVDRLLA